MSVVNILDAERIRPQFYQKEWGLNPKKGSNLKSAKKPISPIRKRRVIKRVIIKF